MLKSFFKKYSLLKSDDDDDSNESEVLNDDNLSSNFNKPCPEDTSSIFNKVVYSWVGPMIMKGYKSTLQLNDIYDLPEDLKIKTSLPIMKKVDLESSKRPLIKHCYMEFTRRNYWVIVFKLISAVPAVLGPLVLQNLLITIQDPHSSIWKAIGLSFLVFLSSLVLSVANQYGFWFGLKNSLQIRGSLTSMIYEKVFRLNNSSKKKFNSGKVMNLIAIDIETFLEYFWNNHIDIVLFPVIIIILLLMLLNLVGISGLCGFGVMLVVIPIATLASSKSSKFYLESLSHSDERVSIISELIGGIRFLKLYAWEKFFLKRIDEKRKPQLQSIFKMVLYWLFSSLITQCLSGLVLLVTFSVYSWLGNKLTVTVAFTALNIFLNLRRPLEMLPECLQRFLKLLRSSQRIEEFLLAHEISPQNVQFIQPNAIHKDVSIENGYFTWVDGEDEGEEDFKANNSDDIEDIDGADNLDSNYIVMKALTPDSSTTIVESSMEGIQGDQALLNSEGADTSTSRLVNIKFNAPHGKLTIICGSVGCGKTTLIQSLIGEIHRLRGTVRSFDNVGFTTQQPFLLSSSLRENILFGKEYDREWYIKVLQACALHVDLNQLPARDLTEIGERGINLSGGQKARIALARAIYSNPDCLILDDPLNAVDSEVAKHLFENCLQGLMANKTRILVTHQLQFLQSADYIAVFQDDTIIQGTYQELKDKGIDFESILKSKQLLEENSNPSSNSSAKHLHKGENESNKLLPIEELISDQVDPDLIEKAKLVIQEDRSEGAVGLSTYLPYFRAGGPLYYFGFIIFVYIASQMLFLGSDLWLAIWTEQSSQNIHPNSYYLLVYCGIIFGFILLIGLRYFLLSKYTLNSAKVLHERLVQSVTYAPCLFFDTNPSGRILNRFSKDSTDVDVRILPAISDFTYCFAYVVISMLLMICLNPLIILPFILLIIFYYYVQKVYRSSSRELKRMESISRSPIFSLLTESINGMVPIRTLGQKERFIKEFQDRIDINQRLYFYNFAVNRWVGVRLEIIASLTVLFASIFACFQTSNPGLASLTITSSLGITGFLNWCVRQYTEVEVKMNSVERLLSYIETPSEESYIHKKHALEENVPPTIISDRWPEKGNIEFQSLEIKYRENSEPVIRDISFKINSNEKIGIVGRTGAGKSSLGWSLFRLVEASKGSIIIDGVDISRISLYDLRSRLSVVPQDPFIFSGTFRLNLDPFGLYTDDEIWDSLEKVQLKKLVSSLPNKINSNISECGDGLSVGEKQLLCLCRALLRNSKIVLFDEASASLDYFTDSIIKKVIRSNFKNSTILTIAHRLDTIIDSDRILVVDAGKLVEFDSPKNLMSDPDSKFSKLVLAQSNNFK